MRAPAAQLRFLRQRDFAPSWPARGRRDGSALDSGDRPRFASMWVVIACCLAVSAVTLLLPSTPTYDPWAWILWGREIVHLDLTTTGGPSWKPLPMLFTIPFSLFGQDVAPYLWLWVARAGALLSCAVAYRLARRLVGGGYGVVAGIAAFLALFSAFKFVRDGALGNSEAMLAAFALWAFERHLAGRRDHALYLGVAAALLRPEAWPFLGLYGLWLWFREPKLRARLVGFALLIPALWFLPEWWGSGDPFRASTRAAHPNPGSPAFAEHPALELVTRLRKAVIAPVKVGFVVAVIYAGVQWVRHRREKETLWLLAGGIAWFGVVAVMTQGGYAGNYRYLIVTTAILAVLGGVGSARVLQGIGILGERLVKRPWAGPAAATAAFVLAIAISAPFISEKANNTKRVLGGLRHEATIYADLKGLVDRAGGRQRLLACGGIFSGPFQTQMMAWELHIHGIQVGWKTTPGPGVAFRTRTVPNGPLVVLPTDDRFRQVIHYKKFRLLTAPPAGQRPGRHSCPVASPYAPHAPLLGNTPGLHPDSPVTPRAE
jgi:hypothetical protein